MVYCQLSIFVIHECILTTAVTVYSSINYATIKCQTKIRIFLRSSEDNTGIHFHQKQCMELTIFMYDLV